MIMENATDFDVFSKETFGHSKFNTLTDVVDKIRLELGGEKGDDEYRATLAYERALDVLNTTFAGKNIWLRVILWDTIITNEELGINDPDLIKFDIKTENSRTLYLHCSQYDTYIVGLILKLIINYELAIEPGLNIQCFYCNFDLPVLVNVYDDRGMDIVTPNGELHQFLLKKYTKWLLNNSQSNG